jgi:hypothetical protein
MKSTIFAVLLSAALAVHAQAPAAPQPPSTAAATCPDCGVVNSVRSIRKEAPTANAADTKPSGLVATVPLGGGKPHVGSSSKYGAEATTGTTTWEVVVRMDDGRFRVLTLGEDPKVQKADKVRIEANRVVPRGN